jgi:hypothetical protein
MIFGLDSFACVCWWFEKPVKLMWEFLTREINKPTRNLIHLYKRPAIVSIVHHGFGKIATA